MKAIVFGVLVVCAACTDSSTGPVPDETTSCKPPVLTQMPATPSTNASCALDFGTCGGTPYAFHCTDSTSIGGVSLSCLCEIDGVSGGDVTFVNFFNATCASANTLSTSRLERAWEDCHVAMTIGP